MSEEVLLKQEGTGGQGVAAGGGQAGARPGGAVLEGAGGAAAEAAAGRDGSPAASARKKAAAARGAGETPDLESYRGVGIFIEQHGGQAAPVAWELAGIGRKLADKLGVELIGFVAGHQVEAVAQEAVERGCDRVLVMDHPALGVYRNEAYARVLTPVIREVKPEIFLLGATTTGRDLAGTIATTLQTGLTADCTQLDVDPETRLLDAIRPAFLEKQLAVILCKKHRPQMATVRPKMMEPAPRQPGRQGEIVRVPVDLDESTLRTRVLGVIDEPDPQAQLERADVVVAGGRGLQDPKNLKLLFDFAQVVGGVVGASRAIVDAGWIGREHQVGQTGLTVRPKVYFAFGISGAIQHTVGMENSELIVAVNKDPDAPIFKVADLGVVGDLFAVVPALQAELARRLDALLAEEPEAGGSTGGQEDGESQGAAAAARAGA
ncbi:electron transfer flavoprotein subunit alpha/FixB family protein [Thermaerobacter subterraneus]|uniref:Electron transfer flavoprotein, alpha subunit n=1 Tax=Thermaerobacter subterraneus DSM 13965 TaxID=867903 RepID=K6PYR3_9FIRM|nr:electron transfer flavoprotein subunit alpha/FixB family protein [Thermaerobacter subterraneus]EKP93883.1 electron transfer flavoprotein, alpha subunit [Thermaerobacter subterraneus DSM 13965]